jgi:hypothetical protein
MGARAAVVIASARGKKDTPRKVWRVFDYANGSGAAGLALALPIGANWGEQEQLAQTWERLLHHRSTQID